MDDNDFNYINELCENHSGWNIAYNKDIIKIWTKSVPNSNLHMIKVIVNFLINNFSFYSNCYSLYFKCINTKYIY
ncbi:unnamed protein product [Brugia timori]|uniref:START domain-containing protein n=1 Tax=Brugia timori TaxID=42155 RepID=A0A3P7T630_9BILA|nr:unnamed protein product [Brugia timori]